MGILGDAAVAIINLLIILVTLLIYTYKENFLKKLNKNPKNLLNSFLSRFKIGRVSWQNLVLSVLILFFLDFALMNLTNTLWSPEESFLSPGFIVSSLISPIGEEFLFRGLFFGILFLWAIPLLVSNTDKKLNKNKLYLASTLVLQSLFFAFVHDNPNLLSFAIRFVGGVIYGLLYILNNYNLLPSILIHMAHNLLINSGAYLEIGKI